VLILCYVYLHMLFVVFDLVLSYGVIVVAPCCRRQRKSLNEPLDAFLFMGGYRTKRRPGFPLLGFVSDIAIVVLKRDVKIQLTGNWSAKYTPLSTNISLNSWKRYEKNIVSRS